MKLGNRAAYEDFLGDASVAVVTDPPFGGKVELVDRCLKSVAQDWRRVNGLRGEPVVWLIVCSGHRDRNLATL